MALSEPMHVGYIVRRYPRYSETFIVREILAHEEAGQAVGLSGRQVRRWRQRWAAGDFALADLPGRGRKAGFSPLGPGGGESHRLRGRRPNRGAAEPSVAGRPDGADAGRPG